MDLDQLDIAGKEVYWPLEAGDVDVTSDALSTIDRSELADELRVSTDDSHVASGLNSLAEGSFRGLRSIEVLEVKS